MASSGSKSVSFTQWDSLKFSWWISSQSVENNSSVVSWKMELVSGQYGQIVASSQSPWEITVNGTTYTGKENIGVNNNATKTLASGSTTIAHNADGNKSFSYSFSQTMHITFSGEYISTVSGSGSGTLDTIARASQPSLVTYPNSTANVGNFGEEFSIHMNTASQSFTHTVRYEYGSRKGTIATGVVNGTTWTVPLSFMNDIPNNTSASGRIYVDTYSGSTLVGTKYTGFTVTVPASVKPGVSFTLEDITGVDDIYGYPVMGLSKIDVTVTATPAYSSPIASCTISANGVNYSGTTATTDILKTSGSSRVTATVTDKRGRSNSVSYDMNVQNYNAPSVSALSVHRCNADGTANDQGGYIKATFSANVSSMNSKNTATYTLKYKKSTATSFTNVAISALANNYSVSNYTYIFEADTNSSYDVEITVQDRHNTASRSTSGSTAFTLMNFNPQGNGIGFGRVCEGQNALEFGLGAEFFERLHAKKGIFIEDTRYDNLSPAEYREKGQHFTVEFKLCSSVNLYDTTSIENLTDSYCTIITLTPWYDKSGGTVKQLLFDDTRIWYRVGNDSWGSWKPILYRTGWSSVDNNVSYRLHDGMCTVSGESTGIIDINPSGVCACVLPENARPSVPIYGTVTTKATNFGQVLVATDGKVWLWNLNREDSYWGFTVSYPVG